MHRPVVFSLLVVFLAGCSNAPDPSLSAVGAPGGGTLSGTVLYLQRVALPPDAEVTITLSDVSRADAPATILGTTTFKAAGRQVPLAWAVAYDPAKIDERMACAVSARITIGGALAWKSDTHTPVLTRGAPKGGVEIRVVPVGNP